MSDAESLDAPHDVYARVLLRRKMGYPLYIPSPNNKSPPEYRAKGVTIGDVGVITPTGAFDFLFNICLPADHPINQSRVPEGFDQVLLEDNLDLMEMPEMYAPGTDFKSKTIKRRHIHLDAGLQDNPLLPIGLGAGFKYESSSSEGAVLLLPNGGSQVDLQNMKKFRDQALWHGKKWFEHATEQRGRFDIKNLYLVTGADKTDQWAIAAFADESSESGGVSLDFKAAQVGEGSVGVAYEWQSFNSVVARVSPVRPRDDETQNQCTFVRGFSIRCRKPLWRSEKILVSPMRGMSGAGKDKYVASHRGGASGWFGGRSSSDRGTRGSGGGSHQDGIEDAPSGDSLSPGDSSGDRSVSPGGSPGGPLDSEGSEAEVTVEPFPPRYEPYHPLAVINEFLLNTLPEVGMVVTHDDDWCTLGDADGDYPNEPDGLIRAIREQYCSIQDQSGNIYLDRRSGDAPVDDAGFPDDKVRIPLAPDDEENLKYDDSTEINTPQQGAVQLPAEGTSTETQAQAEPQGPDALTVSRTKTAQALVVSREAVALDKSERNPVETVDKYNEAVTLLTEAMEALELHIGPPGSRQRQRKNVAGEEAEIRRLKSSRDAYRDRAQDLTRTHNITQEARSTEGTTEAPAIESGEGE